jgi:hypothetical protein
VTTPKTKRTPAETWKAIMDAADEDEMDRILALSDAELDAELRADGFDPAVERAKGVALADELLKAREGRNKWQDGARAKLDGAQARFAARPARRGKLPRADLLAAIDRARNDPRLGTQASVMYRNRGGAEASDADLEDLLAQLEALADQAEAEKKK